MKMLLRLYITVFNIVLFLSVNGQTVNQLIHFADSKFEQGNYRLAAKEYQRALFFGPKTHVGIMNIKTGDCYFEMDSIEKAIRYYRFASTILMDDSLRTEAIFKKSTCNILEHKYHIAIFDLLSINASDAPNAFKKKKTLLGIAYFGLEDFERSEKQFAEAIQEDNPEMQLLLQTLFQNKKLNRPNPEVAYWLSVAIPGAGQLYAGDIKNSINSLGLSFGLMYLGYNMALNSTVWDAIFTILPWYQRYYMGGYGAARRIATAKRDKNRAKIYREIFKLAVNS